MITTLVICLILVVGLAIKPTRNILLGILGLVWAALVAVWALLWAVIYIAFWLSVLIGVPAGVIYGVWYLLHRH